MKLLNLMLSILVFTSPVFGQAKKMTYDCWELTPTITDPAYTAEDSVGGQLEFTDSNPDKARAIRVMNVSISDKSMQNAVYKLWFFCSEPADSAITDAAAFDLHVDDADKLCGRVVDIAAADYDQDQTDNDSYASVATDFIVKMSSNILYAALVATGTPDYAVGDLTIKVCGIKDPGNY